MVTYLFPGWAIQHQLSGDSKEHKVNIEGKGSMDDFETGGLLNEIIDGKDPYMPRRNTCVRSGTTNSS